MPITDYHAKYFAYELTKRSASNSVQKFAATLLDAQVDLNPHQVEAALFAFKSPLSRGAILADEVGLGKTIEAGLVISQKWAERRRKILIVVPSNLRKQWHQELAEKFFLPSVILESASFNQQIKEGNLNPFEQSQIILCSYHFARSKDVYIKHIGWDLVVIDEAHRLRNVYKPGNKIANAIKNAVIAAPKVLLSATPLQNSLLELYGLVSVIDEHTFGDLKSFKKQFVRYEESLDPSYAIDLRARLKPICQRTLRKQVSEYIKFTNRTAITQDFVPSEEEQRLYDLVSSYLQEETLYALPSSQRHLMTLILRKLLASSTYAISGTLEALAGRLDGVLATQEVPAQVGDIVADDFESYDELADDWDDDEEQDADSEDKQAEGKPDIEGIKRERDKLREFQRLAKAIQKNSKGEALLIALRKGFAETERLGGKKKAVIFTESRRTQKYLFDLLNQGEYQGKVVLFNGTNTDPLSRQLYEGWLERNRGTDSVSGSRTADLRSAIVDFFRDEAVIMIATEAAAEGINLQFCSLVVNFDLPWNPQRIEQRIGRCHRYGQQYDVVVVNFINRNNAADVRVYQILDRKFKLFNGVFGASDEVLGSIESGVDFEKRIAKIYQTCRTAEEIQTSFDRLQEELDSQISDNLKDTRKKLLENFDEEVHEKLRVNLRESQDYLSKYEFWLWQMTRHYLEPHASFDDEAHTFELRNNPFPANPILTGKYRFGKHENHANTYRFGHPLAQGIIEDCKKRPLAPVEVHFDYSGAPQLISILEPFLGKSGWITLLNMSLTAFETEDYVICAGRGDDGSTLDEEQCRRLFSLPATVKQTVQESDAASAREELGSIIHRMEAQVFNDTASRNAGYFDSEMEKLDKWAEDIKASLEMELKELDREIKAQRTEAKKIQQLEEKVAVQRNIKEMEKRRNELRMNLFKAQDEVDIRKEGLLADIEARLKQQIERTELFCIRWSLT